MHFDDVRVGVQQTAVGGLGGKMHLRARHLLRQCPHHRRGEHDVADRRKAENKNFH